jgi:Arc/MetJ family transcription regulator
MILDDDLIDQARRLSGIVEKTALVHAALRKLIQVEAGKRLAKLGGTMKSAQGAPRRRPPQFANPSRPRRSK